MGEPFPGLFPSADERLDSPPVSDETLAEMAEVLFRPMCDKSLSPEDRRGFFARLGGVARHLALVPHLSASRDPRNDQFLAPAVGGEADAIISGDKAQSVLSPFINLPLFAPQAFAETIADAGKEPS